MALAPVREGRFRQTLTRIFYRYIVFILLGGLCLGASIALAGTGYLSAQLIESQALMQAATGKAAAEPEAMRKAG